MFAIGVPPPEQQPEQPQGGRRAELSEHKMDILGLFPSDGELEVLSFLEPADLVACCLVSKRWRQLADSNELWRQQCARCWRDKQYISLDMVERHHNRQSGTPASPDSQPWAALLPFTPSAALHEDRPRKWKYVYREALEDARRTLITKEELCAIRWCFRMRSVFGNYVSLHDFPRFREDNTYVSMIWGQILPWRFYGDHQVRVAEYPPLTVTRSANWGWQLTNVFVEFSSLDIDARTDAAALADLDDALAQAEAARRRVIDELSDPESEEAAGGDRRAVDVHDMDLDQDDHVSAQQRFESEDVD